MSVQLRSVTIRIQSDLFEQIKSISEKKGETASDTIRYLITRGLDERVLKENTELITRVVKEQIELTMKTYQELEKPFYQEQSQQRLLKTVDPRKLAICRRRIG